MTEYAKNLLEQYKNLDLPNVRALYSYMYSLIANEFTVEDNILEVGAGLGGSAKFLRSTSIILLIAKHPQLLDLWIYIASHLVIVILMACLP
jgi:uncharacterized membrane protein